MADDGFHEIQLNGKQLVFLFMATTVVAVVIFLGGVMVGRGVRMEQAAAAQPGRLVGEQAPPAGTPEGGTAARSEADDLAYYRGLGKDTPPPETLSPPGDVAPGTQPVASAANPSQAIAPPAAQVDQPLAEKAAVKPAQPQTAPPAPAERPGAEKAPSQAPGAVTPVAEPKAKAGSPPPAGSIVVQVAALEERGEAEETLARLLARNYAAFILPPSSDKYYRVRVGAFKTRREAEAVVRRLQAEGFKPWITR
ncbi:MAG: SPOR domain-containing protein [Vicinamibacterales bacterium]